MLMLVPSSPAWADEVRLVLRAALDRGEFTQALLARVARISQPSVSNFLTGQTKVPPASLYQAAITLCGVDAAHLDIIDHAEAAAHHVQTAALARRLPPERSPGPALAGSDEIAHGEDFVIDDEIEAVGAELVRLSRLLRARRLAAESQQRREARTPPAISPGSRKTVRHRS